jgi:hypothetical protein
LPPAQKTPQFIYAQFGRVSEHTMIAPMKSGSQNEWQTQTGARNSKTRAMDRPAIFQNFEIFVDDTYEDTDAKGS